MTTVPALCLSCSLMQYVGSLEVNLFMINLIDILVGRHDFSKMKRCDIKPEMGGSYKQKEEDGISP